MSRLWRQDPDRHLCAPAPADKPTPKPEEFKQLTVAQLIKHCYRVLNTMQGQMHHRDCTDKGGHNWRRLLGCYAVLTEVTDVSEDFSASTFRFKLFLTRRHGVTSQKCWIFINTDVRISNLPSFLSQEMPRLLCNPELHRRWTFDTGPSIHSVPSATHSHPVNKDPFT